MATIKDRQFSDTNFSHSDKSSNKFSNLNLNQSHKCSESESSTGQFNSKLNNDKNSGHTVIDNYYPKQESRNKTTKDLRLKTSKNLSFAEKSDQVKVTQKRWMNDKTCSNLNNSTLSLHIAAYENSVEAAVSNEVENSSKASKFVMPKFQDSFEFPRQMEGKEGKNEHTKPEVQQFSASQKLLSPNHGNSSRRTKTPATERTQVESKSQSVTVAPITAEEVTQIVPHMPETNATTGKSAKVLVWKDLYVKVPVIQKQSIVQRLKFWEKHENSKREVLHGVSGVAEPGEILAIMGASGAGKTTLLNVLTQRNQKSLDVAGEVTVNGENLTIGEFQRMSSYVQQTDIFMGAVTVREHLIFSARLRMGRRFTDAEKIARVDQIIIQMNLSKCQNTLIGQRHEKSISLGEKKRLAFGCEILTDASIMFCDEPTSGLDAFMAKQVIKALQALADQGKTIVLTIHQPSSQIFNMFDKLCLIAMGEIVFLGPPKKAAGIFKLAGFPMNGRDNPAEFCIEKLALHDGETEEDRKERVHKIKQTYSESNMASLYNERIHGSVSERRRKLGNADVRNSPKYAANWFTQVLWLSIRSFKATLRDPLLLKVRFIQTLLTALCVGLVYWQVQPKKETILTMSGFLFNCVRDCIFMYLFPCLTVFTDEMPVFLRENHANIYRTDAYFIGKNIAELPQYIALPIIYTLITFFMSGVMHGAGEFFVFLAINIIVTNLAVSIGYAAACIFGTTDLATQILPLLTIPLLCLGGIYIQLDDIPDYFLPLRYISWHRYAFESHMINKFENDIEVLDGCKEDMTQCESGYNGPSILQTFAFGESWGFLVRNIGILLFMILLFRTIAVSALVVRARFLK